MATAPTPLYLDWSFWAVVVAVLALVLSQLPPVYLWFRRARLDLETYSRIHITHKIGNPNVQLHLILSNIGGRTVKVKAITIKIIKDGKELCVLPAQSYLQNPSDSNTLLFTSFTLKPKEEWAHIINFLNYFNREDEKNYRSAESRLKEDILEKRKIQKNKEDLIETTNSLITPFMSMFNDNFIWKPGEYEFSISVTASNNTGNINRRYRFTLFESDSIELSKVHHDYKYGDGIYWDSGKHAGIIVPITEV
jgi:hypothetical protein